MQSKATSTEQYLKKLPPDRKEAMSKLRKEILKKKSTFRYNRQK